jgi:hypothetical protein
MTILTPEPAVTFPPWPVPAIRHLLHARSTWLAGGAVRDLLLGRVPHDWDFVLDGSGTHLARTVANALGGYYYALDETRGTGRALVKDPDTHREVTLDFAALRAPTLEEDLRARDFTVNAMALTLDGKLIDPTGGRGDLAGRQVRLTGPSALRDDPIRLIRAVRLATQLEFGFGAGLAGALRDNAEALTSVAPERLRTELVALLALPTASQAIQQTISLHLADWFLPELTTRSPAEIARTISALAALDRVVATSALLDAPDGACESPWVAAWLSEPEERGALAIYLALGVSADSSRAQLLKWAALLCPPSGTPIDRDTLVRSVEHRMMALRFSRRETAFVWQIAIGQEAFSILLAAFGDAQRARLMCSAQRRSIYRYFQTVGDAGIAAAILYLARIATISHAEFGEQKEAAIRAAGALATAYLCRRSEVIEPDSLLSGLDVEDLGIPTGPGIGDALAHLREAQAAGLVTDVIEARRFIQDLAQRSVADRAKGAA